jgi:hypothetical protein
MDSCGYNSKFKTPIPFDYEGALKTFLAQQGLDFGLVALNTLQRENLKASDIIPVSEENRDFDYRKTLDQYYMLGLPKEFTNSKVESKSGSRILEVSLTPTLVPISRLEDLPEDLPNKEEYQTDFPRFIGRVINSSPLNELFGMSGGPIFGFNPEGDHYWIVAISSTWLPSQNIIFGNLIQLPGILGEQAIKMAQERNAPRQPNNT